RHFSDAGVLLYAAVAARGPAACPEAASALGVLSGGGRRRTVRSDHAGARRMRIGRHCEPANTKTKFASESPLCFSEALGQDVTGMSCILSPRSAWSRATR